MKSVSTFEKNFTNLLALKRELVELKTIHSPVLTLYSPNKNIDIKYFPIFFMKMEKKNNSF